ncbi:MAG: bifunctional 4-hydroxy-2-oxoglutarate aldolase/2-dehydro-3-deoxy-phosphogluconate aldolase [Oscillospiraceae bacterium]|nr:bifunctional 4-hydroxy-2-oxoglutarate aldolase/2-dehydro-3-deoxy-phosphogluconate aldolase [Oscillospiraceae bacterium]
MKEQVIQNILTHKVIAIVRGVYGEDCLHLAQALYAGGIRVLEVTFDQAKPEDHIKTADTIRQLNEKLGDKMDFGAGTVTSPELVALTKSAGGRFVISPDSNADVIRATGSAGLVSIPGALTPTEALFAHRCGADFVKLFPVGDFGPSYVKAVSAPLNHIRLLAVGGVNEKNIGAFLKAGAVGTSVGGNLVNKQWIANEEFEKITALAQEYVRAVKEQL